MNKRPSQQQRQGNARWQWRTRSDYRSHRVVAVVGRLRRSSSKRGKQTFATALPGTEGAWRWVGIAGLPRHINNHRFQERLAAYELERLQIFGEDYVPEQSDDASCFDDGGDDEARSAKDGVVAEEGASSEDQLSTTSGDTDGDSDEDGSAGEGEKSTDKDGGDEQPPDEPYPTTD